MKNHVAFAACVLKSEELLSAVRWETGRAHMIECQIFSCCSFFFLSFLLLLICWYMTPAGESWPEASRKREQLKVACLISLRRALRRFYTDNEQSAISSFKRAKKSGWDSRALQCRFPHNPNFMGE